MSAPATGPSLSADARLAPDASPAGGPPTGGGEPFAAQRIAAGAASAAALAVGEPCPDDIVVCEGAVDALSHSGPGESPSLLAGPVPAPVMTSGSAAAGTGAGLTGQVAARPLDTTANPAAAAAAASARETRRGILFGIGAFGMWGVFPAFFKLLAHVSPWEVLAHRVVWSLIFLFILIGINERRRAAARAFLGQGPGGLARTVPVLFVTSILIAFNWGVFIWATMEGFILQASLGYFINPLVSVLLGFVFLRERLTSGQVAGVALAAAAVLWLTLSYGVLPWVALSLAFSFGVYGLLRKVAHVDPVTGLAVETALLAPFALGWLLLLRDRGELAFLSEGALPTTLLLMAAGVLTAIPLLLFANAAKRLRLGTVGLLQYIAPTGQFLLAVLAYGEPFDRTRAIAFALIWVALGIYSLDSIRRRRPSAPA